MKNKTIILENIKYSLNLIETRIKNKSLTNDDETLLVDCISFRLIAIYEGLNEFNKATKNVLVSNYPQIKWEEFKKSIDAIYNEYSSINYEDVLNIYEKHLLPIVSIIDELIEEKLTVLEKLEKVREDFFKKQNGRFWFRLSKENKDKLKELEIFKDKVSFRFNNGWFDLVYELGKNIEEVCKLANCELPQIEDIKSKYSSLRFDYYFKSDIKVPKIVEKLIDSLIYEAEDKSSRICEFCGSDGSSDITEDGALVLKVCDRCKKAESEELNKEKSFLSSGISRRNWYADELLENVAHIQKHANKKDIDVDEYLGFLDKTVKLIERIKVKVDEVEFVDFNAEDYTFNELYKYGNQKRFSKSFIIRKYLGTMNKQDIHTLCSKFGKDRVIKELNYKFRAMFEFGFVDIKGLIIPLTGDYREYGAFKEILEMVNSYE